MENDPVQAMQGLLTRARAVLSGSGNGQLEPTTGTSEDGLVTAVVGADGLVQSLAIDPKVLRRAPVDLAAAIVRAVNQAVDARPDVSPTSTVADDLKQIQEESARHMKALSRELTSAVTRWEAH